MREHNALAISIVVCGLTLQTSTAHAVPEVCGNGIDDDADGYADEGCWPAQVLKVCLTPGALSCAATGDIAPKSGGIVYQVPNPDLTPTVPFGPALTFRRTYMSLWNNSAMANYRRPMGTHWHHNYMSWLDKSGTSVIVHLVTGQDVSFAYSTTIAGYDYYIPQSGFYVTNPPTGQGAFLRQATTSPNNWELRTLTGEKYVYNWVSPIGKLIEIHDTLATPNKLLITYKTSGTQAGQIDFIDDASGHKRFAFVYSGQVVTRINYQTVSGGTPTTRMYVTWAYSGGVPITMTYSGTTSQTMTYSGGYLTSIIDASANHIIDISPVAAAPATVARLTVGEGGVGFEYNSTNPQCSGQTAIFFNVIASPSSCSADTDCGGTYKCGGKTGSGATGKCYRAARCVTTTSPSEDLVTTVAPITPCTGACAPTAQYSWNTTTLGLKGVQLADNNWTSYQRDSNGMVILRAEGDNDDDPTNVGGLKTWFFYSNASFPGRLTEERSHSNIFSETSCDATHVQDCKRTQFTLNPDGLPATEEYDGYTLTATNTQVSFAYVTSYTYDVKGRLTNVDGPLSGTSDATQYVYWSDPDIFKDGYTQFYKRQKDASMFVTTTFDAYDYFGNPGTTKDPDGTVTCRTWDANRNYVTQLREAMAGQLDCSTTNGLDLTTSFVRDSWLRPTKTIMPLGDCQHLEYDSVGRLTNTKRRDDCNAASSGDTKTNTYDSDGLLSKTEFLDAASVVTRRLAGTYFDGRQVANVTNPVSPSYFKALTYNTDGQRDFLTSENGVGKEEVLWDAANRSTTQARYTDAVNHTDWSFAYPFSNSTPARRYETVTDPSGKVLTNKYDDMGRVVKVISPDSNTTLYVYDAASRLVTTVEAYGLADQVSHTFTYDNIGRKLTENYGSESCSGSNPIEVQYSYDELPVGVSCPSGASCANLAGRLAYVKQVLLCTATSPFHLDQQTFYGYDAAGRLISEEIDDPSPRAVQQNYTWDKNGNLTSVSAPSGSSAVYTYGGAGNSDANLVTTLARSVSGSPTNLLTNILWKPFGPVAQYDQSNTIGGNSIRATLAWNLAYRATQIKYAATGASKTQIDYVEDEKGRYTQKLYSNVFAGVANDYLQYDWLDRPTCDATVSGSCPTSGSTLKTNVTNYNSSNDRAQFNHQDVTFGDLSYSLGFSSGADRVTLITKSDVSTTCAWDGRGNRVNEDNLNSTVDKRTYTYDARRRVRTVSGNYRRHFGINWVNPPYMITYAYDHKDRVVFRQFQDQSGVPFTSQYFYYYDVNDRVIEIKVVGDIANPSVYTVYDFYWLGKRPVASWVTWSDGSTTRLFIHADDVNRPLEAYDWPSTGDATNVWALNPDVFGWDRIVNNAGTFMPLRMNGTLYDDGTIAYSGPSTWDRPGLLFDHGVFYDPMTETVLTRSGTYPSEPYARGDHNPSLGIASTSSSISRRTRRKACGHSGLPSSMRLAWWTGQGCPSCGPIIGPLGGAGGTLDGTTAVPQQPERVCWDCDSSDTKGLLNCKITINGPLKDCGSECGPGYCTCWGTLGCSDPEPEPEPGGPIPNGAYEAPEQPPHRYPPVVPSDPPRVVGARG